MPEDVVKEKRSYTGAYLKPVLAKGGPAGRGGGVAGLNVFAVWPSPCVADDDFLAGRRAELSEVLKDDVL